MWRPSECLWCPISLILAEYDVLQRTSVTTTTKSATFTAQTLHGRHALMSEKLSIGKKNHGSCVNNEVGTASSMRPSAAWDIWDKVWRAKKNVFALFVRSCCLKQSHHCCSCWNTVAQGDVTRTLVYSEEAQFTWSWFTSSRASRGRRFQKKKELYSKDIECAQGDRPARCPNHFFAVAWWWCDLFWCHEVACGVRWSNVVGCELTWGELLWHVMSCHVIWCGGHVIWCDVIHCVVSCHVMQAMSCDVRSRDELSPVVPCNGMECYKLKRPLVVRSRCVVRSGSVTMWCCKVLFCTTLYYSSTSLYYTVLPRTTP